MTEKFFRMTIAAAACLGAALTGARAEEAKPGATPVYTPQVSDFMSETQLRHFKLWFSGSLSNWPLAAFELAKMKTSFDLAAEFDAKTDPNFADLMKASADPAFKDLEAAIAANNEAAFIQGFERLTKSCNACHAASGLSFIKIQTPTASPFSDQSFAP